MVPVCFVLGLFVLSAEAGQSQWGYDGDKGPTQWGSLSRKNVACDEGKAQSPVNLVWHPPEKQRTLEFLYKETEFRIIDNGHTVQVNFPEGSHFKVADETFELVQIHFHAESEHTISGRHYPLEAHFVHKDKVGNLAVIGVMLVEGGSHTEIEKIWSHIPKEKNKEVAVQETLNPSALIPAIHTHYVYQGSLTTPPCSEGVRWNVFNTPIEISKAQIRAFQSYYKGSNRPVQPLYNRSPANY